MIFTNQTRDFMHIKSPRKICSRCTLAIQYWRDLDYMLCMHIGDVGWNISPELEELILKELSEHLDGEFSDEFAPSILGAIETIKSCNRWGNTR